VLSILASGRLNPKNLVVTAYLSEGGAPFKSADIDWTGIFKAPYASRTIPVTIAILMSYGAQLSVLTLLPMMMVAQGYTLSASLFYTMVIQFGSFLGTVAASALGYKFPRKRILTMGAICACLASLCFGFLGANIYLLLFFGALFQFFVLVLNTTIWIYAPELYPTRSRAFGVAFILASGTAAGAIMPLISGRVLDGYGLPGVFTMIAVMYGIFAACIQFGPETYGKSMEDINVAALPETP
jgi:MFS family permease